MPPHRLRSLIIAALSLVAIGLAGAPARAQSQGTYRLDMLTAGQKDQLFQRVDRYALVESFLTACGRPPALELRVRRIVRGCVAPNSLEVVAAHFRRSLAARSAARWNCETDEARRMIARSEQTLRLAFDDLARACSRPES
ncbi:hypothetical protein [Phreatobacter stygius]|uniref:UrcA family protein n=1 Tax=Phreatobacter stygius TaxID=1940610 RepID=A0A4D7B0W4_9HYPH|nr:hypothetical protein [Phreatobacter stygius]QCI64418.1 hypothetical protein E8M01_09350 [Phreatobacter stygius]